MIRIGVSGWSFDEWKDGFYAEVPKRLWLQHYASHFPTVEVNYTFRRTMSATTAATWRELVGPDFRFAVKAHQRITHTKRLRDPAENLPHFLASLEPLGDQLGPVLFQTAPHLPRDDERLTAFLAALPAWLTAVFEVRNETWDDPAVHALLRGAGAGWVISETDELAAPEVISGPVVYLRLRKQEYTESDLAAWAERLVATEAESVWAYVKHEDDSPRLAARLAGLVASVGR